MIKITVFTPTYNREKLLRNLYLCLKNQTFKDFEWLIVDDGSTDETESLVSKWKKENKLNISYIFQKNGGKQRAYNCGIRNAKGELFICIDSDDLYINQGLSKILNYWDKINDKEEYAGLTYLSIYPNGEIIGTQFPNNNFDSNHYDIYYKYHVKGDKGMMFRTNVLREFYFPEIKGEKFVTEAILYNRIAMKYKTRYINEKIEIKEYYDDGLSKKIEKLYYENQKGYKLYFSELQSMAKDFETKLKATYSYVIYLKKTGRTTLEILKTVDFKLICLAILPIVHLKNKRK